MAETYRDRLLRLLGIVTYLERHGTVPFSELAEHFGVSVTRIRADINALWTSGLPGYQHGDLLDFDFEAFDRDEASLIDSQGVTQVRLSARETVALVGALSTLIATGTAPQLAEDVLSRLRETIGGAEPVTVLKADDGVAPQVRDTLLDAIERRRAVTVDYVDAHDRRTERTIEPHRLVTIDGHGYVECFCRRAADYRTLRLDRIVSAQGREDAIAHPPSDASGFAMEPRFDAEVRITRGGRWALEDLPGATIEDDGDDTVLARFGVSDAAWVAGRLLAIAPHLVHVVPAELRDALARQADAVMAAQAG